MADWDGEGVALLGRAATDLTALAATIEVLRRRRPADATVGRAQELVLRLHETVSHLGEQLKR